MIFSLIFVSTQSPLHVIHLTSGSCHAIAPTTAVTHPITSSAMSHFLAASLAAAAPTAASTTVSTPLPVASATTAILPAAITAATSNVAVLSHVMTTLSPTVAAPVGLVPWHIRDPHHMTTRAKRQDRTRVSCRSVESLDRCMFNFSNSEDISVYSLGSQLVTGYGCRALGSS